MSRMPGLRSRVARVPGARKARRMLLRGRAIASTQVALGRRLATQPRVGEAGALLDVLSLVNPERTRIVVMLVHSSQRVDVVRWLDKLRGDEVHVISQKETAEWELSTRGVRWHKARGLEQIDLELKKVGTIDLLVTLLPTDLVPGKGNDQYTLFQRFFRYVNRGGAYVLDRTTSPASAALLGMERWVRLLAASEDQALKQGLPQHDVDLAESTGSVIISRDLVLATKRIEHLVKLRDADVESVLPQREPKLSVRVLERRRAREFVSRATPVSHGGLVAADTFAQRFAVPALTGRRYEGRIGSPGGTLLYAGHTVLPDSFRWHLADNPRNVRLVAAVPGFSRLESRYFPRRVLPGNYYSLDSSHSGHFGHITTEVISRLWGWDRAKAEVPDLKAFFHLKPGADRHPQLEIDLLMAYGIAREDIAWVNEPVWLESVSSATPMWHNSSPYYVDPDIVSVWDRLTDGLLARAPKTPTAEKIFVSRAVSNRTCHNRTEVEDYFTAHGFRVILPEQMPLPEQVALFSGARVVAGFAGSNMFNLMHARRLETLIVLSHDGYLARNEHLFSAVRGGEAHYFWSPADIPHPPGGYSKKAFQSNWTFDFAANRAELEEIVSAQHA